MKRISSILIMSLLFVSIIGSAVTIGLAQEPAPPAVGVVWEVVDEFEEFSHEEENSQWIFGPQPKVVIYYADNGTDIAENFFRVDHNTDLLVNITIPKSFLGEGNALDTVHFWGTTWAPMSPIFVLEYNVTADAWNHLNVHYEAGSQTPSQSDFLELDEAESSYVEETQYYGVEFAITFTDEDISGLFWTGMQAIDTEGRPVSPSWLARMETGFETPPIGLGASVNPRDYSLPNYYYADIVDTNEEIIHYVGDNETFIVRLLSGVEVGEVLIPFALLDWDPDVQQWVNYSMPLGWPLSMFDPDAPMVDIEVKLGPMMFLVYNASGAQVVIGYPQIEFIWVQADAEIGIWFPEFSIKHNSTLDLSEYFEVDPLYTNSTDGNTKITWGGYFTNNTDMDMDPFKTGAVIRPELGLSKVLDTNGDIIEPRPEIREKETMKLAYKADFIEAFVLDQYGNVAEFANQAEPLNLTMIVHAPEEHENGTLYLEHSDGTQFRINTTLNNFTIQVLGEGYDRNDTHHWRTTVIYQMTLKFSDMTWETKTVFTTYTWLIGGELVDTDTVETDLWTVTGFSIDIEDEETVLKVDFSFKATAPSMVLTDAKSYVGLIQNVQYWNGTHWSQLHPWYGTPVTEWIDIQTIKELSGDTIWSPRHLRLGDIDYYRPPLWTVTEDGAIDLDGNTYTTDDQYFVKRTGYWRDWGNITTEGMGVYVGFDPSPGNDGDEFHSHSWMAIRTLMLEFEANETFYWYHADDMTLVGAAEMDEILDTMWADIDEEIPVPGYEYVAWLTINRTIDLTSITGLDSNSWETTWFAWGTQQTFQVGITENSRTWAAFRAQYAGLLLFKDDPTEDSPDAPDFAIEDGKIVTSEVTHVVLIDSVEEVEIRQPFGATNGSGQVVVDPETEINFGISIHNVSVTIYPLQIEHADGIRGPWRFRESYDGALGLNSTNFDYWITHAEVDEMAFDITFDVDLVQYDPEDETTWNHAVSFKIDQYFGDWTLDEFDTSTLDDYGLAVNFFGVLATATRTQYQAGEKPVTDPNGDSEDADYYQFGAANTVFANVSMGGLPYTSGIDDHATTYISGSSSAPIGAFSAMYESASGDTVTDWTVDASMLFMTAGYTHWGGNDLIVDPVFVAYSSAHQTEYEPASTTPPPTGPREGNGALMLLVGGAVVIVVIIVVVLRRRRY